MNDYVSLVITVVVIIIAAGIIGYAAYNKFKTGMPGFNFNSPKVVDLIKIFKFILDSIDDFIGELQEVTEDIGGINRESFESDTEYHNALIEAAVTIVEKRAVEIGITFKLSHTTLVNLSELVLTEVMRVLNDKEKIKSLEEDVESATSESGKTDITEEFHSFYDK